LLKLIRRRIVAGILIGIVVVLAVFIIGDASALADAFRTFDWRLVPVILGLTLLNYLLRFVKWQFYLRYLRIGPISRRDSLLVFVSGFTMAMTPGKVGELLKSYLVRIKTGVPMARSGPVIVAERVTDGLAMLVLAGVGLVAFRDGWEILAASAVIAIIGLLLVQHEPTMRRILHRLGSLRFFKERATAIEEMYVSTRTLLGPRPFGIGIGIGVISWFCECLAFYLVLVGLDIPRSADLLLAATFVFAASAWIGGLSLLPGGLGVAEASVATLLLLTVKEPEMTRPVAATATLLIRFATLWFGVLLGVAALARVATWDDPESNTNRRVLSRTDIEGVAATHE
jgi:uncharacterized protein (TIRG00374 family)